MALDEADGAEPEPGEGRDEEPGVVTARNVLESFAESQEVRGLIGGLAGLCGDPGARETAVEKFIGERLGPREGSAPGQGRGAGCAWVAVRTRAQQAAQVRLCARCALQMHIALSRGA